MKKHSLIVAFAAIAIIFASACKKNNNGTDTANTPPSAEAYAKLLNDGFKSLLQTATFDASNNAYTYTSPKGTKVTIDGTCLRKNGAAVTGQVTLEFLEVYKRTDMLIANVHTVGGPAKYTGDDVLLQSGGIFYLCIKQDGIVLTTTCKVQIVASLMNSDKNFVPNAVGFDGIITADGLRWQLAGRWDVTSDHRNGVYKFMVPGCGWFNIASFYNFGTPLTSIAAYVPTNYSNVSDVYVLPKSLPRSLGIAYGKWPIGVECYFVFVTEKDGKYSWIIRETTLKENHTEYFNNISDAKTGSREEFLDQLDKLL
ncbi:MAG: hypothetical protein ACK4EY_07685 [Flavipsychrobacter sp.]